MKFNVEGHKALWNWLAENTDMTKRNWPGWKKNGGEYDDESIMGLCFACDYVAYMMELGEEDDFVLKCNFCPLKEWRDLMHGMAEGENPCIESYYGDFNRSQGEARKELALIIANMEVVED
jgi:hypothetical protein